VIALPKPGKDPKLPQNLRPISLLPPTRKKVILRIIQRHVEGNNIPNPYQFGFRARHSTTLQCMRLADHVTLNFNNDMSTATVFLDIENSFDTTWHPGLLYKLSELHFSSSLIKRINSSLSHRKFRVMVEGELSTTRNIQAKMLQGSVLPPTPYGLYLNDRLQTLAVYRCLPMIRACIPLIAKRIMSLESSSAVLPQWSRGASAGTLRLTKRRLRPSTSPIGAHQSKLLLH